MNEIRQDQCLISITVYITLVKDTQFLSIPQTSDYQIAVLRKVPRYTISRSRLGKCNCQGEAGLAENLTPTTVRTKGLALYRWTVGLRITVMLSRQIKTAALRSATPRNSCVINAIASPLIRTYAQVAPSQTASAPDSKPPVALFGLDGTYASALVRLKTLFSLLQGIMLDVHGKMGANRNVKKVYCCSQNLGPRQHFQSLSRSFRSVQEGC